MKKVIFCIIFLSLIFFSDYRPKVIINETQAPINFWFSEKQLNLVMSPERGLSFFYKYFINGQEFTQQANGKSKFSDAILVARIFPGEVMEITYDSIPKISEEELLKRLKEQIDKPDIKL